MEVEPSRLLLLAPGGLAGVGRAGRRGWGMEMVERLPFGMRTPVAVTYARCGGR